MPKMSLQNRLLLKVRGAGKKPGPRPPREDTMAFMAAYPTYYPTVTDEFVIESLCEVWIEQRASTGESADRFLMRMRYGPELVANVYVDDPSSIPASMRVKTPDEATYPEILEEASQGRVHFRTPLPIVFRACFQRYLREDEEPAMIAFGGLRALTGDPKPQEDLSDIEAEPGWVLLTEQRLLWHARRNGIPGGPNEMLERLPIAGGEAELSELAPLTVQPAHVHGDPIPTEIQNLVLKLENLSASSGEQWRLVVGLDVDEYGMRLASALMRS